ncbi:potassium-transporting ATPase subunit KdpA, partial [Escherichia coli]
LNTQQFTRLSWDQALKTPHSLVTKTNTQTYIGETTFTNFIHKAGLNVQKIISDPSRIAVIFSHKPAFKRHSNSTQGKSRVDHQPKTIMVLVPV